MTWQWVLDRHPNVISYFYGHHHHHEICRDHRATACRRFWEIQTASLVEFPQEARRIRIKYACNGLAFLELVSFREQLTSSSDARAQAVQLARRGAERDLCRTVEGTQCSEDLRVYRADGRDANARLWFTLPGWQPSSKPELSPR